jgi:isopenicillin N synthase-like dioxygenase
VIDVSALWAGGSTEHLATELLRVYGTIGFGYVVGHGVPDDVLEGVFDASRRFHRLPPARKLAVELDGLHRGFIPIDTSTDVTSPLADVTKPNQSESFMVMREAGPDDPQVVAGTYLAGPNQWPEGLPGFREAVDRYQAAVSLLAHRLVAVIAEGLGDVEGRIERSFHPPTTWLRLLHYPPQPPMIEEGLYGSAPHADFGCLTILAQDDVGGLEVATPDGRWSVAPPVAGAFVVNVGQMLHRWSNGRMLATPHRVVNRSGRERWSVPFFYDPNVTSVIEPLPSCIDADTPPAYEPLVYGDFVRHQLESSYLHHHLPDRP